MTEKVGALWKKKSKEKGVEFWSGEITLDDKKTRIVVFKNKEKEEGTNQPDYNILESKPREEPKEEIKVEEERIK